ncbi:MAG: hypothetical protein AAFR21_11675 [Pseudomonadota bacterium]
MKLIARITLLVLFLMAPSVLLAQSQRMAVPVGSYTVGGGGGSRIDAHCVDQHRTTPSGPMTSVLGPADSASVTRLSDNETLPLGEAMEANWIVIDGDDYESLYISAPSGGQYRIDIEQTIALSEQTGEVEADILPTLTWLDEAAGRNDLDVFDVWAHRSATAQDTLGEAVKYAPYFDGANQLVELQARVSSAGPNTIAVTHADSGGDTWDRVVVTSDGSILTFSGPDADRRLVEQLRSQEGSPEVWIASPKNLQHLQPFTQAVAERRQRYREAYTDAPWGSEEEAEALEAYRDLDDLITAASLSATKLGLLAVDADTFSGADTLTVAEVPRPTLPEASSGSGGGIVVRDGIFTAFGDREPPLSGAGGGGGQIPPNLPLADGDRQPYQIGTARQNGQLWTNAVFGKTSLATTKVENFFAATFGALQSSILSNASQNEVVRSVEQAITFSEEAYQAFPRVGDIEVRLFLDEAELLNVTVAVFETPKGTRFAAIARDSE